MPAFRRGPRFGELVGASPQDREWWRFQCALPANGDPCGYTISNLTDITLTDRWCLSCTGSNATPMSIGMRGKRWLGSTTCWSWHLNFQKKQIPGSLSYNLGNVFARGGALNPASEWSFTIIDQLFAKFADLFGSACSKYNIFGHSAGAQLVHRMALLFPYSPFDLAKAANAGWYTLPDLKPCLALWIARYERGWGCALSAVCT